MIRLLAAIALIALVGLLFWLYTPDKPRAALEAKYLTAADRFVEIDGIRLRMRDTGPRGAPALILLHGFGSSLETWESWATILAADYRVIRFDLPGFGLTGPDPTGDYSDGRGVTLVEALMDELHLDHATIIGNSLGGKIAWMFAAAHPERTSKLVLISPDGFASPGFAYGKPAEVPFMVRLLPYTLPDPLLRMSLEPAYGDPKHLTKPTFERYRDMMLAPGDRAAMVARMRQVMLQNPISILQTIKAPTLLLWGEQDGMIPIDNAMDYRRAIPKTIFVALPGLGHVPFEEAPDVSIKPLLSFLRN